MQQLHAIWPHLFMTVVWHRPGGQAVHLTFCPPCRGPGVNASVTCTWQGFRASSHPNTQLIRGSNYLPESSCILPRQNPLLVQASAPLTQQVAAFKVFCQPADLPCRDPPPPLLAGMGRTNIDSMRTEGRNHFLPLPARHRQGNSREPGCLVLQGLLPNPAEAVWQQQKLMCIKPAPTLPCQDSRGIISSPTSIQWLCTQPPTSPEPLLPCYLDQWPLVRLVEQLDDCCDAIVEAHRVLGHLGLRVPAGEVPEGADSWFGDILLVTCSQDSVDQGLHPIGLCDQCLVLTVVAGQVGEGASGTGQHVHIIRAQLVNQDLEDSI